MVTNKQLREWKAACCGDNALYFAKLTFVALPACIAEIERLQKLVKTHNESTQNIYMITDHIEEYLRDN